VKDVFFHPSSFIFHPFPRETSMTEASDSPQGKPAEPAVTLPTPTGPSGAQAFPELSPPGAEAGETYRSLSLLAAAALVLAGFYTLMVGVGLVVALVMRSPWILPLWTFLIPMLCLMLSWIARVRIQSSEGVLTGLALTRWSVGLSVCVGLSYLAYYAATALAVRQQADYFARQWLNEVKKGNKPADPGQPFTGIEKAFWLSLRPPRPAANAALRNTLEARYNNTPDFTNLQSLSGFNQMEYVRLLEMAGDDAQIELNGINSWNYEKGGYDVILTYQITTPVSIFYLQMGLQGLESRTREWSGRQWHVILTGTKIVENPAQTGPGQLMQPTPEGNELGRLWGTGAAVTNNWMEALRRGDLLSAFFLTLPPSERQNLSKSLAGKPLEEVRQALDPKTLKRFDAFLKGDLVSAGKEHFWAIDDAKRDLVTAEMRKMFAANTGSENFQMLKGRSRMGLTQQVGDRLILRYDFQLTRHSFDPMEPPVLVEVRVVISGKKTEVKEDNNAWQVDALELIRTRTAPPSRGGAAVPPGGPR
jgi:hypothetical protein